MDLRGGGSCGKGMGEGKKGKTAIGMYYINEK